MSVEDNAAMKATEIDGGGAWARCWAMGGHGRGLSLTDAQRAHVRGTAKSAGAARCCVMAPGHDASVEDDAARELTEITGGGALARCWAMKGRMRGSR